MKYEIVIFDFDGTLADSFPWFVGAVNDAADRHGFRRMEEHEIETLRGYDPRKMVAHLGMPMRKMPLIVREVRKRMARDIQQISLFPGVDELLRRLTANGIAIAIVTSNSAENVRQILGPQNAALVRYYGCGASIFGKRAKLKKVLRNSRIPAAKAICIGDEIRDIHAAHAENIAFGAVSWGFANLESLLAHSPQEVFTDMAEIVEKVTRDEAHQP